MAETISSVSVRLDADTAEYIRALKDAQQETQRRLTRMQREFNTTAKAIRRSSALINTAIGAMVAAFSVDFFAGIISETIEVTTEQQRLAAQLNLTTDEFRSYEYAGKFLGKSGEEIADVFKEVNERFEDASRGAGEARALLDELGISVEEFIGLKPDEQYGRLAKQLDNLDFNTAAYWADKFGDQLYQTYLVQRRLGISVTELREEYDELFGINSTQLDDQIQSAQRSMIQIEEIWNRFKVSFTAAIAPALNEALEAAVNYLRELGGGNVSIGIIKATNDLIQGLEGIVNGFIGAAEYLYNTFVRIYNSLPQSVRTPSGDEQNERLKEIGKREIEINEIIERGTKSRTTYRGGELVTIKEVNKEAKEAQKELALLREEAAGLTLELENLEPQTLVEKSFARVDIPTLKVPITATVTLEDGKKPEELADTLPADFGETDTIFNSQYDQIDKQYNQQLELQRRFLEQKLISQNEFDQQEIALQKQHAMAVIRQDQVTAQQRADAWKVSQEQITAVLQQAGSTLLTYANQMAGASDEEKKGLRDRFLQNQAFALAQASVNYFAQLAAIQLASSQAFGILGPAQAAVQSAQATVAYIANVAGIAGTTLIGGAFHGGVDEVPASMNNKSFLLKEGERVVQPEANQMLTSFLENQSRGGGTSDNVTVNAPVNINGSVLNDSDVMRIVAKHPAEVAASVQKAQRRRPTAQRRV